MPIIGGLTSLILFIIAVIIAVWVYRDAQERYPENSPMPLIWLLIVLLTGILGLVVYLIVRPPKRGQQNW